MSRTHLAVIAPVVLALAASAATHAAAIITHQYDFEPPTTSGPVTQSGWTHVQYNTFYTPTTAGFDSSRTAFYYTNSDEPAQSATPYTNMQRDWLGALINYPPTSDPNVSIVFREIVPADAGFVKFTIWRNSVDPYTPNFTTTVQVGDSTGTVFTTYATDPGGVDRSVPITGAFNFPAISTTRYLDFVFSASGTKRLDGIETTFPEPSSLSILAIAGVVAMRRRRR